MLALAVMCLAIATWAGNKPTVRMGIANKEVRIGYGESLCKYNAARLSSKAYLQKAFADLRLRGDLDGFMARLTDFFHSIPYDATVATEKHYQSLLYAVLASFGADILAEDCASDGRADIVLRLPQDIYVIELKYGRPLTLPWSSCTAKTMPPSGAATAAASVCWA